MFVRPQQKDADGAYAFCLEMDDSLSVYSLDFYTRIDCPPEDFAALGDMQLEETCGTWYNSYSGAHQLCFYYVGTTITLGHGDRQNIVMFNGSVRSVKILPYTGTGDAAARVDFTMKR